MAASGPYYGQLPPPQHQYQPQPQTVNPALLFSQSYNTLPHPNRPLNPVNVSKLVTSSESNNAPTSSPYVNDANQDLFMGSVGYSTRFARTQMGDGHTDWQASNTYKPEPLEPLFRELGSLKPLPPLDPAFDKPAVPKYGGDMGWFLGKPQSGPVEWTVRVMCNGQERLATQNGYIKRTMVH
ncbi:hypothetical protein NM208_g14380 [Fusarium decemcellulare]|uniref:Uncharacterized protein n=1 Tax=Fusarium decemcellulare TaxID=57161 RepID=A0ACC1RG86_9HYPO|nr:hypothetical protein NM208_g14380 [Fusarium decemcellulare]